MSDLFLVSTNLQTLYVSAVSFAAAHTKAGTLIAQGEVINSITFLGTVHAA